MLKDVLKTKYHEINIVHEEGKPRQEISSPRICSKCSAPLSEQELIQNYRVCHHCGHHYTLGAWERISLLADEETFREFDSDQVSFNRLDFPEYDAKLERARQESGLPEALVTGTAYIDGYQVVLGVMDSRFMMASMGAVVGEKICRAADRAVELKWPLIIVVASGGARMQEGMVSLLQMAKTSAVIQRLHQAGILYISILTNPTTGGVLASFASLADLMIAEPGALVGFAGPRVIEQTIKHKLPENFQRSEFLLQHGMLDLVVERSRLKEKLSLLLKMHGGKYDTTQV
ncbi:MAG TPA: acetyl-CoA carboxylase, carboxyltransferase subunit beta [Syntrophomonadaceae bacterium]|nr:acetyl-CoA carboxylase, carboxyltransferase subunit beta [Syntrophomonadaceae bacterium]